jgi:hypothetical protein
MENTYVDKVSSQTPPTMMFSYNKSFKAPRSSDLPFLSYGHFAAWANKAFGLGFVNASIRVSVLAPRTEWCAPEESSLRWVAHTSKFDSIPGEHAYQLRGQLKRGFCETCLWPCSRRTQKVKVVTVIRVNDADSARKMNFKNRARFLEVDLA